LSVTATVKNDHPLPPGISLVVPVYNSEQSLGALATRLQEVMPGLGQSYELILVNDGSRDASWQVIQQLCVKFSWVRGINLMRNYGQHNALLCGIRAARYHAVVTLDDDLQHPPEEIHKLITALNEGYDVVYGTPRVKQHDLWRNLASHILRLALQGSMGVENARKVSAFRALRTQLREAFQEYQSPHVTLDALLTWGASRFIAIPTEHAPRHIGKSNYNFGKLFLQGVNMVTHFTILPLQIASLTGFAFAIFGGLVLLYVLGRYLLLGYSMPGFPFLASIIAIFSGVQLFSLGIIGEYLARMHFRLMGKPSYVINDQTRVSDGVNEDTPSDASNGDKADGLAGETLGAPRP
jgi:undecaprenyl-phosphate 4-deoxy-4-formamido-L-arabinose transferase